MIEIDPTARISKFADIEDSSRGTRIVIGANSIVDSFVKIKPVGGTGDLIIGKYVYINSGCVLYTGTGIIIEDYALIAANCTLAPVNHEFISRSEVIQKQGFKPSRGGIIVKKDAWIGAGSVLLDGCVVGEGCVVGAGSVIRGTLEPYTVYVGNPLRVVARRV